MIIYLLRHGEAAPATSGQPDAGRGLTAEGRRQVAAVVRWGRAAGPVPGLILSSPFARAIQSAEIAAEVMEYSQPVERTSALVPSASPFQAWDEIRAQASEPGVLAVAHEPLLSALAAMVLGAPALRIRMDPGSLIGIEIEALRPEPNGWLRWMLIPAMA